MLDLIVFGATGFTGKVAAEYLAKTYGKAIAWGIAGRSEEKLKKLASTLTDKSNNSLTVPMFQADADDEDSLKRLAENTKVILSTVGPYDKYGRKLVKVCAESGTHYCDITGETSFVADMKDEYNDVAKRTGAKIVPFCGFDSIPSDLGTYFAVKTLRERFGCPCDQVDAYVTKMKGGLSGGTAASFINMFDRPWDEFKKLMKRMSHPYALCMEEPNKTRQPKSQKGLWYSSEVGRITYPFVMAPVNSKVVLWSNSLLGNQYGPEFKYTECSTSRLNFKGATAAVATSLFVPTIATLACFETTRNYLKNKMPQPGDGPDEAARNAGCFELTMIARGTQDGKPVTVTTAISGDKDPGYYETCKFLVESGICLAEGGEGVVEEGGLYSTAAAMGEPLMKRLSDKEIKFEVKDAKL